MNAQETSQPGVETRHQLLIDAVTDYAIYMLDSSGIVTSWNAGAQRFKGYTAAEILGRHFSAFYREDDREAGAPERALATAASEGRFETEAWRVRKDGTEFFASVVIDAIRDPQGQLLGFAKITRDITDRMRARQELLDSERRFRILVQGVTDYAIYMLDPGGYVSNWNPGAERIKHFSADEIVGQHFSRFYTPEDQDSGLPARALQTAETEGRFEAEGWRVRKDGSRFWASVVIDAIRNDAGELIGFAKITRDRTEHRLAQEQLEQTQQALFQAQKMDAIGQLTGGVAHDFNNLLTVIVSSLDLLRRKVSEPRDIRIVENALMAAERGSQLTHQLLAFARRQSLRPEPHNPNLLIETFEAILRRGAGDNVILEIELARDMHEVLVDHTQFEAALLNLVVNARDASGDDGTVLLATEVVTIDQPRPLMLSNIDPGVYVRTTVSDSGSGMSAETLARACEPFFTTKDIGKGTGLGLSQVYGFVAQSNGYIDIASAEGLGTAVSLYLPAGAPVAAKSPENAGVQAGTVLIVDDDEQVMNVAVEMFASLGYDVLTANDATEAVDILMRDRKIDVLFSDVVMPRGMNGIELAREARMMRPDMKIILASGYPLPAIEKAKADLSETAFIAKPYRWSEVVERLRALDAG
ncbi:histidine kinase [Terrihabitans soli]|uniref:histidine kinase n=1 Tax=Terrihabitans soli TaxID=708113 RepID=A0A6S6QVL0_9HYPH|nr:PAS domain-containing sensor histidine kinase [Terrihabitans soli]BCJ91111.1 histidine kinase [Terrihabitans soli]